MALAAGESAGFGAGTAVAAMSAKISAAATAIAAVSQTPLAWAFP